MSWKTARILLVEQACVHASQLASTIFYVCRVLPNTVCVQVDDIKKAIQSLEGKIRTLTPEPMVHTHRNVKMYI